MLGEGEVGGVVEGVLVLEARILLLMARDGSCVENLAFLCEPFCFQNPIWIRLSARSVAICGNGGGCGGGPCICSGGELAAGLDDRGDGGGLALFLPSGFRGGLQGGGRMVLTGIAK